MKGKNFDSTSLKRFTLAGLMKRNNIYIKSSFLTFLQLGISFLFELNLLFYFFRIKRIFLNFFLIFCISSILFFGSIKQLTQFWIHFCLSNFFNSSFFMTCSMIFYFCCSFVVCYFSLFHFSLFIFIIYLFITVICYQLITFVLVG